MFSCFSGGHRSRHGDLEPLLPVYEDETTRQQLLHEKLHTYQQFRAIGKGFMPSTEQLIANLRSLLAADILNPLDSTVSDSSRMLTKYIRQLLQHFIELLRETNSNDQVQDFIWCLVHASVTLDTKDLSRRASQLKTKADARAAISSVQTIGSLLLANSDFRIVLNDLQVIFREILRDTAGTASKVAEDIGNQVDPTASGQADADAIQNVDAQTAPTEENLNQSMQQVSSTVRQGAEQVASTAKESARDHLQGTEKNVLFKRLESAVTRLRRRPDYTESVNLLTLMIQRYFKVYSKAAEETATTLQEDVQTNREVELALENFWSFVSNFGDKNEWIRLEDLFKKLAKKGQADPHFEQSVTQIANEINRLLQDPSYFQAPQESLDEVRQKLQANGDASQLTSDVNELLQQVRRTLASVGRDGKVDRLINDVLGIWSCMADRRQIIDQDLLRDLVNVFIPLLIQSVQHIPIPRLELSTPSLDLLLENLILEPGETVNNTSFLPFRLRLENYNDVEIRKTHARGTVSRTATFAAIKVDGLTLRAEDVGFWFSAHPNPLMRLAGQGLASLRCDRRGIDIHLDVEVGRDQLEQVLSLRAVRVRIHRLSYTIRGNRFVSCLAATFHPIISRILRAFVERRLAAGIKDLCRFMNRELIFARERLRATRVADPRDLATFVKAVLARLTPDPDPDLAVRVGVRPPHRGEEALAGSEAFRGRYAPGSVVRVWEEEGRRAGERVDDWQRDGWRNDVFDIKGVEVGVSAGA